MPRLVARAFLVVLDVLFSVKFREVVHDETVALHLCFQQRFHEGGGHLGWSRAQADVAGKVGDHEGAAVGVEFRV